MIYRSIKLIIIFLCSTSAFAAYDQQWALQCENIVRKSQEDDGPGSMDSSRALFVWLGRQNAKNHNLRRIFYNSFYNPDVRYFHGLSGQLNCKKLANDLNDGKIDLESMNTLKISDIMDHSSLRRKIVLEEAYGETLGVKYRDAIVGKNSGDKGYAVTGSKFDLNILAFFFPRLKKLDIDHEVINPEGLNKFKNLESIYFKEEPHQNISFHKANEVLHKTRHIQSLKRISFESPSNHSLSYDTLGLWLEQDNSRRITLPLKKENESFKTTSENNISFLKNTAIWNQYSSAHYNKLLSSKVTHKSHMIIDYKHLMKHANVERIQEIRNH
ncbi:MAG: hypothetical protein AB8C84_05555 [Oligoflexales bacterium]